MPDPIKFNISKTMVSTTLPLDQNHFDSPSTVARKLASRDQFIPSETSRRSTALEPLLAEAKIGEVDCASCEYKKYIYDKITSTTKPFTDKHAAYAKYFISIGLDDVGALFLKAIINRNNALPITEEEERQLGIWMECYHIPNQAKKFIDSKIALRDIQDLGSVSDWRELDQMVNDLEIKPSGKNLHELAQRIEAVQHNIKRQRKDSYTWDHGVSAGLENYMGKLLTQTIPKMYKVMNEQNSPFNKENIKHTLMHEHDLTETQATELIARIQEGVIPQDKFEQLCHNIEIFEHLNAEERAQLTAQAYYHAFKISLTDIIDPLIHKGGELEELNFLWGDKCTKILHSRILQSNRIIDTYEKELTGLHGSLENTMNRLSSSVSQPVPILHGVFEFLSPVDEHITEEQRFLLEQIGTNNEKITNTKELLEMIRWGKFRQEIDNVSQTINLHVKHGETELAYKKRLGAFITFGSALKQSPEFYKEIIGTIKLLQAEYQLPNDLAKNDYSYSEIMGLIGCINNGVYKECRFGGELSKLASSKVLEFIDLHPTSTTLSTILPDLQDSLNNLQTLAVASDSGNRFESVRDFMKDNAEKIHQMLTAINVDDVKKIAAYVNDFAREVKDPTLKNALTERLKYYKSVISLLEDKNCRNLVAKVRDITFNTSDWNGWIESKQYIDDLVSYVGGTLVAIGASMVLTPTASPAAFAAYMALTTGGNIALSEIASEIKHHVFYDGKNHIHGSSIGDHFSRGNSDFANDEDFKNAFGTQAGFNVFMRSISMGTGIFSTQAFNKFVNSKLGQQFIKAKLPTFVRMKLNMNLIEKHFQGQIPAQLQKGLYPNLSFMVHNAVTDGEYYLAGKTFEAMSAEVDRHSMFLQVVTQMLAGLAVKTKNMPLGFNHLAFKSKNDLKSFLSPQEKHTITDISENNLIVTIHNTKKSPTLNIEVSVTSTNSGISITGMKLLDNNFVIPVTQNLLTPQPVHTVLPSKLLPNNPVLYQAP